MTINIEFRGCSITAQNRLRLQYEILQAIKQSPATINILFATRGGEISEALLFYKFIREIEFQINIYNIGEIRSSGTVMFLAFDNRYFLNNAKFLFHSVRLREETTITPQKEAKSKEFNEEMLMIFKQRAELPEEHIRTISETKDDINIDDPVEIENYSIAVKSTKTFSIDIRIPCSPEENA